MKTGRRLTVAIGAIALAAAAAYAETDGPDAETRRRGREVYAAQCAVCHGVDGDGAGMAAHMLRVQPRDFRRGLFKFRSTPTGSLPLDHDLLGIVTEGVRWTAMVGRRDLPEEDRRAVVQYLKTFSPRFAAEPAAPPVTVPPAPERSRGLLEEGARVYRDAGCATCHGERGHGDGSSGAGMKDDWGRPTWPSDLTWRPLKRGSSPHATYLTIATGLAGTPMPSYGDALGSVEIWALVHYLESLVPPDRRLSPARTLGDEAHGWMALRMGPMHRMRMMR